MLLDGFDLYRQTPLCQTWAKGANFGLPKKPLVLPSGAE
jgi:hypothetical protein